jgi:hypothetical protein
MSWQGFVKCELNVAKRRYAPNYVEKQKVPEFQHYSIKAVQYQTAVDRFSLREIKLKYLVYLILLFMMLLDDTVLILSKSFFFRRQSAIIIVTSRSKKSNSFSRAASIIAN